MLRDLLGAVVRVTAHTQVCVIGGGMAGLTLARQLGRAGIDTVVLESGGLARDDDTDALNSVEVDGPYAGAQSSRCRGLGGTSQLWGGRMIPLSSFESGRRDYLSEPGWPLPPGTLEPYAADVAALFGLDESGFDDLPGEHEFNDDPDVTCRWAKWPSFARCNLAIRLRAELAASPRLAIWTNATVCDFAFGPGGRLASVTARSASGSEIVVHAAHFVLAAGTIESTRLLLWLHRLGDGQLRPAAPALGRFFQDHLWLRAARIDRGDSAASSRAFGYRFTGDTRRSLHLELSPQAQQQDRVRGAFAYVAMDLSGSILSHAKAFGRGLQAGRLRFADLAAMGRNTPLIARALFWRYRRQLLFVPPEIPLYLDICAEQHPSWNNVLSLSADPDRFGVPRAALRWLPGIEDERTLRATVRRLRQFWDRRGLSNRFPLSWSPACLDPAGRLIDEARDYYHPSGTARMGADAAAAVVSPDLRSWAVDNLSVLSAAVFPAAGSANPTYTLLQLAFRLGGRLAAERTAKAA